jgi:hypothetical protein
MPTGLDPQLAAINEQLDALVEDAVKAVTINATAKLIAATPVKTGWARANWIPSVAEPREDPAGSPDAVSESAQAQGLAEVAAYRITEGPAAPAYVTNAVPYISRLNAGSSAQAPAEFVQRAIDQAVIDAQADAAAGVTVMRDRMAELNAVLGV